MDNTETKMQNPYVYESRKINHIDEKFEGLISKYNIDFMGVSKEKKICMYISDESVIEKINNDFKMEIENGWIEVFKLQGNVKITKTK